MQLVGAAVSLVVDVGSYLFSAACLLTLPSSSERAGSRASGGMLAQMREGLVYVRRDPVIGPMALAAASLNFTAAALAAMFSPFLVHTLDLNPAAVGALIASDGLGGVVGAAIANRTVQLLGTARAALGAICAAPLFALMIGAATQGFGLSLFVLGNLGLAAATVVFSIVARTHRQVAVPSEMLARVMATVRFISWGVLPIGGLVAGTLAQLLGMRTAILLTAATLLLGPVPMLLSPARHRRELIPDETEDEPGPGTRKAVPQ